MISSIIYYAGSIVIVASPRLILSRNAIYRLFLCSLYDGGAALYRPAPVHRAGPVRLPGSIMGLFLS